MLLGYEEYSEGDIHEVWIILEVEIIHQTIARDLMELKLELMWQFNSKSKIKKHSQGGSTLNSQLRIYNLQS